MVPRGPGSRPVGEAHADEARSGPEIDVRLVKMSAVRNPAIREFVSVHLLSGRSAGYNRDMKQNTLSVTNPHLRAEAKAARRRMRSVASSTVIETGQPVSEIEARIRHLRSLPPRVTLA